MKTTITIIFFILSITSVAAGEKLLMQEQIVISDASMKRDNCIAHQSFSSIGSAERHLYVHEIVYGYLAVENRCSPLDANATLYLKLNSGYKEIFDHGQVSPATHVYFSVYPQSSFLVLVTDFDDGGNAGYPHQSAYILDDHNKIHGIDISKLESWVKSQIKQDQHTRSVSSGIDYRKTPLMYGERIFNKSDHYRHPTGGVLSAKLQIVNEGASYKIKILDKQNKVSARDLNEDGLKLYRNKQYKEAVKLFKKATAVNKKYWMAWNNQALALYKLGDYKQSIDAAWMVYTSRNVSRSAMANAAYNIAKSYEALGNLPHSLKFYKSAYELVPNKTRQKAIAAIKKKMN